MLCQQAGKEYVPSYVRNGLLTNQRLSSPVWRLVRMLAGVYLLVLRHSSYSVALVGMELRILPRKWWECRCEPHVLQRLLVVLGSLDGQTITIPQPEALDRVHSWNSQLQLESSGTVWLKSNGVGAANDKPVLTTITDWLLSMEHWQIQTDVGLLLKRELTFQSWHMPFSLSTNVKPPERPLMWAYVCIAKGLRKQPGLCPCLRCCCWSK